MKGGKEYRKRKRKRLMRLQDSRCYYCGAEMTLPNTSTKNRKSDATFEHLDSRLNMTRGKHVGKRRIVLACRKCNGEKNDAEQSEISSTLLTIRAQVGHRLKELKREQ